ncbi:BTAD domain-containing putative transcriptional regulator [Nocardioides sp.]|uniref:BTAD domain-containing putative transcriptional regulator n=1 Tax=Nocardioides sp. TaxID=35761 RepID=UPI001A226B41|nr:BTAD domain-containing putative transcriptional regulator [Nocardioides sp.]MBJ7358191.1 AAA family ATPase [Nocardioides sp.]
MVAAWFRKHGGASAVDGEATLRLRVLGELAATRDGAVVDLGGRRQRAVLAALVVLRDQVVSADHLAHCVWGDHLPSNPAGAVQAYVSHLRRRLQPEAAARSRDAVIASEAPGYVLLLPPDSVDAWCFERAVDAAAGLAPGEAAHTLDEALRLWRGPAYAEYAGEPWVEAEVRRLSELRALARERLLEARLQQGDAAVVIGELEALVAEDPLREERWRLLALALYRAHRQAGALEALRRARETLAEELGVDPGPALRALEAEILAQSPTLDAPAPRPPVELPMDPPVEVPTGEEISAPIVGTDLVDRERELATLRRMVDELSQGRPGSLLIEGPAGIGKSRLLEETVRLAGAAGARVYSARASQLEQSYGFGVVRQLFEPCLGDAAAAGTLLAGAAAVAKPVFEDGAGDDPLHHGGFAVLHGLYWLTVNLAGEGPLVICVDDIQWSDSASLRYLAYLVKRLEGVPVLLALAMRTGEQHPDEGLLAELALDPSVTVLRPAPLSADAAAALVHERLGEGEAPFVEACHRMTSGNPLLLRQLLRALADEGVPPDVSHVDTVRAVGSRAVSALVTLRLRRMPPAVTAVARAVAVLGEAAGLPTVAALAQQPEDQVAAALDTLSRSEILKEEEHLTFVHPLVREAVYDDLSAGERALHHERAAEVLAQHGATPEQVAAHVLRAPRRGSAATVELLRAAAGTAVSRGAAEAAVALLRRALEEPVTGPDRAQVLVELGRVEVNVDGPAGVAHLTEAYAALDDPRERALLAMGIVRTHLFASPPGVATAFAREAASALPDSLDGERQGLLALQRITGYMHGLPADAYRAGSMPEVSGAGDGARMLAATLSYELLRDGRDRAGSIRLARFALEGDRLLEVDNGLFWVFAATVRLLADDDLGGFWDRALARAQAAGDLFATLSATLWRGFWQWRHGRLDDALRSLADAAEQQQTWGLSGATSTYAAAFTIGVLVDRGDLDAATDTLDRARELPWVGEGGRLMREAAARLLVERGRPEEALAELTAHRDHPQVTNPVWSAWRAPLARALAALGRVEEAVAVAEEEVALLRTWGAPTALGPSLRVLGEVRGADGTPDLREAVEVLTGTIAVLEEARARLALGSSPQVPADEAVPLLQAALSTARACGARAVARDAEAALAAVGLKSSSSRPGHPGAPRS